MGLESASFIDGLTITNPLGTDGKDKGDDHLRLIKKVVKASFPGMGGAAWRIQGKSGAYTVLATDNMSVIRCTAALTLTLTAAATLGNQHMFIAFADGGIVTIDGNASETINGATTYLVADGAAAIVFCDGSNSFAMTIPSGATFRHEWRKGGDLTAANPLVIDTDGNYFDVSGNTNFATMTVKAGTFFILQFDGTPTITHGAAMDMPGEANFTAAAGDRMICFAQADDDVQVLAIAKADGSPIAIGNNSIDETKLKDAFIADFSEVVVAAGDSFLLGDVGDSGNTKRDTIQGILDLVSAGFTLGTEQSTSSGTSVTFGSIPAGTTMIIIMFEGVSLSGVYDITLGDAGGLETSGYVSTSMYLDDSNANVVDASTAAFTMSSDTTSVASGLMTLTLKDSANFTWISSHAVKLSTTRVVQGGGDKSLSAELTQVSISGGTFDAGSINIMHQ